MWSVKPFVRCLVLADSSVLGECVGRVGIDNQFLAVVTSAVYLLFVTVCTGVVHFLVMPYTGSVVVGYMECVGLERRRIEMDECLDDTVTTVQCRQGGDNGGIFGITLSVVSYNAVSAASVQMVNERVFALRPYGQFQDKDRVRRCWCGRNRVNVRT